ncbi:MAG: FtsX-like permease family protein [Mycetocola sp.]
MRPDLRAALRLAVRHLGRNRAASAVSAVALAIPLGAVVAVAVIAPAAEPAGFGGGWTLSMVLATAQFALLALLLVGAMVAAAMLVSVRRNERMLALLSAVGATPRTLLIVISAQGILLGAGGGVIAVGLGFIAGTLVSGETPGAGAVATAIATLLASVLAGWAMSLVPAFATQGIQTAAALRDAPRPPRTSKTRGRAGHWVALAGLGTLAIGAVAGLSGAALNDSPLATLLQTAGMLLATPGALALLLGIALALPAIFRAIGHRAHTPGSALRFAARDAERGGSRSLATAASVMAACFLISSYLSFFAANEVWAKETYAWTLQQNQVAVDLIVYPETPGDGILERDIIDDPAALADVTGIIEESFDTDEPRVIMGVPGPHWGLPVDDVEGYSGSYPVRFPTGGLPHPRLQPDGACAVAADDGGPAESLCAEHPYAFELPQLTPTIWAVDADDLALILGRDPDAATKAAFDAGSAIVLDPRYFSADGTVTVDWWGAAQFVPENEPGEFLPTGTPLSTVTLDGVTVEQEHPTDFGVVVSTETASAAGLDTVAARILAQSPRWPDDATTRSAGEELAAVDERLGLITEHGPERPDHRWSWGATGIAAGIILVLALASIGLSRFDGSRTDATLHALGAGAGIRRRINAWYALLVAGLGAIAGTTAGALSIFCTAFALGSSAPQLPVGQLAVVALAAPLLAAGVAWLLPVGSRRMPRAD